MSEERREFYCPGDDKNGNPCPLRDGCALFNTDINPKKHLHWAFGPFNVNKNICDKFIDGEKFTVINNDVRRKISGDTDNTTGAFTN